MIELPPGIEDLPDEELFRLLAEIEGTPKIEPFVLSDLKIISKSEGKGGGKLVSLAPNESQEMYLDDISDYCPSFDWRKNIFDITGLRLDVLKYRQWGCSTITIGLYLLDTLNHAHVQSRIIAHNPTTTADLLQIARIMYDNLDPKRRPTLVYDNRGELGFSNGSSIRVMLVGSKGAGRGGTVKNFLLCLSENHFVIGRNGEPIKITEAVGKQVRTGYGRLATVEAISKSRTSDLGHDHLLSISVTGNPQHPLEVTPDHLIMCRTPEGKSEAGKPIPRGGYPVWKRADEITDRDYVAFPLTEFSRTIKSLPFDRVNNSLTHTPPRLNLTNGLGYLVGLYLAEGSMGTCKSAIGPTRFHVDLHSKEKEKAERVIIEGDGLCTSVHTAEKGNRLRITFNGSTLARWILLRFGRADTKVIPDSVWKYPKEFQLGLIKGFFDGDGSYLSPTQVSMCSIRPRLIVQMKRLLTSFRIGYGSIHVQQESTKYNRNNRERWTLILSGTANLKFRKMFGLPIQGRCQPIKQRYWKRSKRPGRDHFWARVQSVEKIEAPEFVYDLVLDHEDHCYTTTAGIVHNSERAFWPSNGNEIEYGLLQSVPSGGNVVRETTANGLDDFYQQYKEDEAGQRDYKPLFYGWAPHKDYSRKLPQNFKVDKKEEELQRLYGLSDGQLCFRREKTKEALSLGKKFEQEYPLNSTEAFIGSGSNYYNNDYLLNLAQYMRSKEGTEVHKPAMSIAIGENGFHCAFKVFKEPEPGKLYVGGADPAGGISKDGKQNHASFHLFDLETWEEVLHYHGDPDPWDFGIDIAAIASWYADASVAVLRMNHGHETIRAMRECSCMGIVCDEDSQYGIIENSRTKVEMDDKLGTIINDMARGEPGLALHSVETVEELITYSHLPGAKAGASGTAFDDRQSSLKAAVWQLIRDDRRYKLPQKAPPEPELIYGSGRRR